MRSICSVRRERLLRLAAAVAQHGQRDEVPRAQPDRLSARLAARAHAAREAVQEHRRATRGLGMTGSEVMVKKSRPRADN